MAGIAAQPDPIVSMIQAILKARLKGLLRLRPANANLRFDCLGSDCSLCCQVLHPTDWTREQEILLREVGQIDLSGRSCTTGCEALSNGLCSLYTKRPKGCVEYPWYNIDGQLFYDLGCPGFQRGEGNSPDIQDITPVKNYYKALPKWLLRPLISLFRFW